MVRDVVDWTFPGLHLVLTELLEDSSADIPLELVVVELPSLVFGQLPLQGRSTPDGLPPVVL